MFLSLLIILIIVLVAGAVFLAPDNPGDDSSALMRGLAQIRGLGDDTDRDKTTTVYKWQDADGEWHFSNTPPPQGVATQIQTYRSDTNTIPAPQHTLQHSPQAEPANSNPPPGLGALDAATRVMDDARAVQGLSDNRLKTLNEQIDANN